MFLSSSLIFFFIVISLIYLNPYLYYSFLTLQFIYLMIDSHSVGGFLLSCVNLVTRFFKDI